MIACLLIPGFELRAALRERAGIEGRVGCLVLDDARGEPVIGEGLPLADLAATGFKDRQNRFFGGPRVSSGFQNDESAGL